MGIFNEAVTAVLRLFAGEPDAPIKVAPIPEPRAQVTDLNALYSPEWNEQYSLGIDRLSRYTDFDEMDIQSGELAAQLDAAVNLALTWPDNLAYDNTSEMARLEAFKIDMLGRYGTSGAKKVIETTLVQTQIKAKMW